MPLETVERYNLLKHFVGMLPPSNQAVHDSAVLARRHLEYYDPAVMSQILSQVWVLAVLCCAVLKPKVSLSLMTSVCMPFEP